MYGYSTAGNPVGSPWGTHEVAGGAEKIQMGTREMYRNFKRKRARKYTREPSWKALCQEPAHPACRGVTSKAGTANIAETIQGTIEKVKGTRTENTRKIPRNSWGTDRVRDKLHDSRNEYKELRTR